MRILALVSDSFGGNGGIAKFNRDLLSALCAQPEVERVVALPRLVTEDSGALPAKLDYDTRGVGGKICYALALLRSCLVHRPCSMILCGHINLLPLAFFARALLPGSCPVVLVVHGIDAWWPSQRRFVAQLDALISVSEFTKARFLAWAAPTHAKSFILPNCVDLARFTPGEKPARLARKYGLEGKQVLLTVGRLSAAERYKGIDEVLDVLPSLAEELPSLAYLIVGEGTDRVRLEGKAAQLGLGDRVKFAGRISDAELLAHYRLADAFVMPGWGEGFGIVYLEALASGLPVVASKLDASAEVVAGCEWASTVDPKVPDELKAGIRAVLKLPRGDKSSFIARFSEERFNVRCAEILQALPRLRSVA